MSTRLTTAVETGLLQATLPVSVSTVNGTKLTTYVCVTYTVYCRSQWPRGLSHELSSLARTLGSWVRNPLKAGMSVCAFILCSCYFMRRSRPCDGLITDPRSPYRLYKEITKPKKWPGPTKDCRATDEWLINIRILLLFYYYCSTALFSALAPIPVSRSYTQSVGILGRGISPSQGFYPHTQQHEHRINAHTDTHASSGT
jgi:hypothetical protein